MNFDPKNIAIIGASGAIGGAFKKALSEKYPDACLYALSRQGVCEYGYSEIDYTDEESIARSADMVSRHCPLDMVIVATGMLHDEYRSPEKSLKDLSAENLHHVFAVNTVIPALIAKHFVPKLNKKDPVIFAVLSARVGSISDNHLGGWYSYRASKSALNMIIKNVSIELGRRHKHSLVVGLHPGTVDSPLSKPFQNGVSIKTLFSPDDSVEKLLTVLEALTPKESGKCFAWDGHEILP